jgi:DNA-binding MarR family transcriptional regulator
MSNAPMPPLQSNVDWKTAHAYRDIRFEKSDDVLWKLRPEEDRPDGVETDLAGEVWRLMTSVLMVRKEQFPQIAASFGLNPGAMHALLSLDPDAPESMSTLAGHWKCDASNVTWLVDRLEEHGLAERRAQPGDRRIRTVALTPKGAKVRNQIEARMYEPPESLRALSIREESIGESDPATAQTLNSLAAVYTVQGRYAEADRLCRRALAIEEKALGPEHPQVSATLDNLASICRRRSQLQTALDLSLRADQIARGFHGHRT